jgi:hypothetical protein
VYTYGYDDKNSVSISHLHTTLVWKRDQTDRLTDRQTD